MTLTLKYVWVTCVVRETSSLSMIILKNLMSLSMIDESKKAKSCESTTMLIIKIIKKKIIVMTTLDHHHRDNLISIIVVINVRCNSTFNIINNDIRVSFILISYNIRLAIKSFDSQISKINSIINRHIHKISSSLWLFFNVFKLSHHKIHLTQKTRKSRISKILATRYISRKTIAKIISRKMISIIVMIIKTIVIIKAITMTFKIVFKVKKFIMSSCRTKTRSQLMRINSR